MLAGFLIMSVAQPGNTPTPGMVIRKSTTFAKGDYRLANSDETAKSAAITIEGNNLTVDFSGTTLRGTPATTEPNERKGTAIIVKGKNVTIKNVKVHGYQNGLVAFDSPGIKILDCDFSYNYKPKLLSTQEKEDLSDWMSYHHNDNDEWLKGSADGNPPKFPAIYLSRCDGFEVKGVTAEGGVNGLLLNRSNKGKVWNSDFSFLSAVGLAMYRSSDNQIMHNKIDWCVRGFSYGKYNRGQDSAGILIYEQSNRNIFAYNSVTHGGDGFFLWAGQTTMDSGEGGCNDNILYANDFSHAPTNGIEVTFSRNVIANNLILECWHGIWGGYSYDTKIEGNFFGYNAEGIAIEHGQNNEIRGNIFHRDHEGVVLWANEGAPDPSWGYPKHRDTRSMDYAITDNKFWHNALRAMRLNNTLDAQIKRNLFYANADVVQTTGKADGQSWADNRIAALTMPNVPNAGEITVIGKEYETLPARSSLAQLAGEWIDPWDYSAQFKTEWNPWLRPAGAPNRLQQTTEPEQKRITAALKHYVAPLKGGMDPFLKKDALRGWRYMIVDEWGPYDFKRPMIRFRDFHPTSGGTTAMDGGVVMAFDVLGPPGTWKFVSGKNVSQINPTGEVPGMILALVPRDQVGQIDIQLEYTGAATTDYRGVVTPAGKPVRFGYSKFEIPIDWNVKFYRWNKSSSPADVHAAPDEAALQDIFKAAPVVEKQLTKLDFAGYAFDDKVGAKNYATVSEGTFDVAPGDYNLELTTDDGARVWLDGKPIIEDAWKYQGPTAYTRRITVTSGPHKLRIEHFQIDGYATLKLDLKPIKK
jgi:nitrous oxidase accessory protein NosD